MKPPLDPRRRAFADALGRLLADAVWAEITRGDEAARNAKPGSVGTDRPGFAEDNDRVEANRRD